MPKMRFLHNPRCSKSRQALQLLTDRKIELEVVEYLKTPLSQAEIRELFEQLNFDSVLSMMRMKESEFKQAGLTQDSSDDDLISAIAKYPKLLERPVLIVGSNAVIGRPPEKVLDLL